MARKTPDKATAQGMLKSIRNSHKCGEACTATVTHGDGRVVTLRCPYSLLDVNAPVDRRIIQTIWVDEAQAAREALKR